MVAGYEVVVAQPFENRHVLDKIPDFYERLRGSYDARFFEQEALGEYLNVQAGVVYQGFQRKRNVRRVGDRRSVAVVLGAGLQRGSDEFDRGAEERRRDSGAG